MPEICRFFGIIISMYSDHHRPPHFHVRFAEYKATIEIESADILEGRLPIKQKRLVQTWTEIHRIELRYNWKEGQSETPNFIKIDPLS